VHEHDDWAASRISGVIDPKASSRDARLTSDWLIMAAAQSLGD
jgi:hypothetical protein